MYSILHRKERGAIGQLPDGSENNEIDEGTYRPLGCDSEKITSGRALAADRLGLNLATRGMLRNPETASARVHRKSDRDGVKAEPPLQSSA
jgi:hypothetical protein